ncbi:DUF4020 domain-containing protein [Lysobacter maris]|uniref:DUF4020 domain-containing protein n=1 Tax=Marilutibacter maris TaxID=1605891 RepID=A0A508B0M1_9GAMM|nr:DUF4020 domain-containing protein [Lysobacter maris]KAB8198398.1 DUF4020 domain-containing protein [Lysobacter maris]
MLRLGNLDFDDRILDAITDSKLVVFAGAGVSMGPPSNLDSFWRLAEKIARNTGLAPDLPLDRFLGVLQHRGVAVHQRAVELLSPEGSAPNDLHRDLIRLFGAADRIKLVTTNFDLHFETAAQEVYGSSPEAYRAPALPLGYDFHGIVHVHGALPHASSVVLTDADFGRAYLTEGWARRFLLDVFRTHTVLFVGYSHDDVVMNYLARALPADGSAERYALTETDGQWNLLGIQPIRFVKGEGAEAFRELYHGVAKLAERGARGALDWQSRMLELVGRAPPVDPELVGEIEQALRDVSTCRLFTDVARDVSWPKWLDGRKQLEALFRPGELREREVQVALWLAKHYAIEHFDECFDLIAGHGLKLNPVLWCAVGRELGLEKGKPIEAATLRRWIRLLLESAPERADRHVLMWLAERCESLGLVDDALSLFLQMCIHKFEVKRGYGWRESEDDEERFRLTAECSLQTDRWTLNEVYENQIKPHLSELAQPLLSGLIYRFERMHADLTAWSGARDEWDSMSYRRSAIEPHEQDRYTEASDVLIDAARDAMEWLGENHPGQLDAQIECLSSSRLPLLRRLAVHAVASHSSKSADERLSWVRSHVGLDSLAEHHEVHRLAALSYPGATDVARQALIDAIVAITFEDTDNRLDEARTQRFQFDWLSWLLAAKPDCAQAEAALVPVRARFPQWVVSEHPDLTHWMGSAGWVGSESPWPTEQLIAQPPREQLDALLEFRGTDFDGPSREGLLSAVRDAAKSVPDWGFQLVAELEQRALWSSDLWSATLRGFQDAELDSAQWRRLLEAVGRNDLHTEHARDIADVLLRLVKDGDKPFASEFLAIAAPIAEHLWVVLDSYDDVDFDNDWLTRAINRPSGVLVEYWLAALSLTLKNKEGADWAMPAYYRERFTEAINDPASKGAHARSLLASQAAFLFRLDEAWVREHLIPLFQDADSRIFAQAWHGFLAWGRLYPPLVDALLPAFLTAVARAPAELPEHRKRLIEFYAALCVFHVDDPLQQLLPNLFQHGAEEDRTTFASQIEHMLRQLEPSGIDKVWEGWLSRYWQDRLQGVLAPLAPGECREMIEWLPHLGAHFPAGVQLATRMPALPAEHNHVLFELRTSDLVTRFKEATAQLLIYLSDGVAEYELAYLTEVAARLDALPDPIRLRLQEALVRAGAR